MNNWRITKYNPLLRNQEGWFIGSDWTSISDIGKTYNGKTLTMDVYLAIEASYLLVAQSFCKETDTVTLRVSELELFNTIERLIYQGAYINVNEFYEGMSIDTQTIDPLIAAVLREFIWCKLSGDNGFYIHFGYDYYMYIGCANETPNSLNLATRLGLFVEPSKSPYLT